MRALDTNIIIRFLVKDHVAQARRARSLLEQAEATGDRFLIATSVMLETIWVLSAVYDFSRGETLDALDLIAQMPIFEFEDYEITRELIHLGRASKVDLSDLLIGLAGQASGAKTTITFEKGLESTGLFERL